MECFGDQKGSVTETISQKSFQLSPLNLTSSYKISLCSFNQAEHIMESFHVARSCEKLAHHGSSFCLTGITNEAREHLWCSGVTEQLGGRLTLGVGRPAV